MSNQEPETDLLARLLAIESSLARLEQKLDHGLILVSDTYRYGRLRDFLAAGQWKEADRETTKLMVEIAGKASQDEIAPEDLRTFPCSAIRTLDRLWTNYSRDRFGFSVQLRLYQALGGSMDAIRTQNNEFLQRAGEKIGWRKNGRRIEYDDFDFSLSAPEGGLPGEWWHSPYGAKMANFFLARLISCEL